VENEDSTDKVNSENTKKGEGSNDVTPESKHESATESAEKEDNVNEEDLTKTTDNGLPLTATADKSSSFSCGINRVEEEKGKESSSSIHLPKTDPIDKYLPPGMVDIASDAPSPTRDTANSCNSNDEFYECEDF